MIKVRIGVVLIENGAVLLICHNSAPRNKAFFSEHPGPIDNKRYWVFPGGELRQGETLYGCARRELLEETGIEIDLGQLLFFGETIWPDGERHIVNMFFAAKRIKGTVGKPEFTPPNECLDFPSFIPIAKCEEIALYPQVGEMLKGIADGKVLKGEYLGNLWIPD